MDAPPPVKELLEYAASQVLRVTNQNLFVEDAPMGPVDLSIDPIIRLTKTGGTTGHQQQGGNYISYTLEIPSLRRAGYSIYVTRAAKDPAINQQALARAILWFISHYFNGSMYTRDEPAT